MPEAFAERARDIAASCGVDISATTVSSLVDLVSACTRPFDLLLSFSTGIVVPEHIIRSPNILAVNVHAASPDFPGRDPHHFAVYYGAKRYGATMHYMAARVDQGPIIDVELFDVPDRMSPHWLLDKANEAGFRLLRRFFNAYRITGAPTTRRDIAWGPRKFKRSDFIELCRVDCEMNQIEFLRRLEATAMPGFNNLYVDIHGHRFRLEGKLR